MARLSDLTGFEKCCESVRNILSQMCSTSFYKQVVILSMAFIAAAVSYAQPVDSAGVKALFSDPPREYSSAPLWVWNDMLSEEQIISTLRDMAGQNVRQAFVHPRPGLMTPYLSKDWFRLWKIALKEAERLDMNLWIYDENSYPSGFAGGLVPEAMPQSRGRSLLIEEVEQPKWSDQVVAIYRLTNGRCENVTQAIKNDTQMRRGSYIVASLTWAKNSPWHGGKYYVNLLTPGVTEKFLEITMGAYHHEIGKEFGKRIPGVFTDEPHIRPARGCPWTDDLPRMFEKRWGYKLTEHLPSLILPVGDWKRVRHNYFQLLLELYIERWAKPFYEYCDKYGLAFTGHYWEHRWPGCVSVPDNMAMSAWQHIPGIDTLMNQYSESVKAQFGNVRAVKELSSVANQLGRKRTLCEAYGAGGWDLRFEDMKRIGDWLYVLGINLLDEHLSFITIRGARKRDHPQSFSYHEPWWQDYHSLASYFTRLSAALSQGKQLSRILVIEPTTTAWIYQPDLSHSDYLRKLGDQFQNFVVDLAKAQVEYDIGCEDIIARHGSVEESLLKIGQMKYDIVVLPPLTENLNSRTMELLEVYAKAGGKVLCCGEPPTLIDGSPSDRGKIASENPGWKKIMPGNVIAMLEKRSEDGFAVRLKAADNNLIYHHRRQFTDGQLLFIVNTSINSKGAGFVLSGARSVEKWDPQTGSVSLYPWRIESSGLRADFELAPCGSLLLFLSDKQVKRAAPVSTKLSRVAPAGVIQISRIQPNVFTLDYVDIAVGGEIRKNIYSYNASKFIFEKHGMSGNPWDSAVQFRDELIKKTFAPGSGFEATYRFTIKDIVPKPLYFVMERPDLYKITCNDEAVSAERGSWWLDKSFGKIDISDSARPGENSITIKASPMTIYHELESAYVLGDFSLKAVDSGFVIVKTEPLELGRWNEQGCPLYSAGVSYKQQFSISQPAEDYVVSLNEWYGSVARVLVNGAAAGVIYHQPWQCDVTKFIKPGTNSIKVVVIGTLRNTLGPHHGNQPFGSTWPGSFRKAQETGPPSGSKYQTIGYGLFKPFDLSIRRFEK
ncbi:MAG: glycosyl hydrolase [Planctomycetota bacterium]|jgi:hypothetical protein